MGSKIVVSVKELNQRLAALYNEAEAAKLPINDDWEHGCPPCGTFASEEDVCVGCPYALRDAGYVYTPRETYE
jgi:hypothetical protein